MKWLCISIKKLVAKPALWRFIFCTKEKIKMKVILFNNIVTPTNTPLFNGLFQFFQKRDDEFKVIFTSATESNRSYDTSTEEVKFLFDYIILENKMIKLNSNKDNHFFHFNLDIPSILDKEKPDIIIHA